MVDNQGLQYQPFYCEENVWCLAQRADLVTGPAEVVFIFGPDHPDGRSRAGGSLAEAMGSPSGCRLEARVACWYQRAAREGEAVLWDYHVILAERRPAAPGAEPAVIIWDLDTRLPCPCPAALWIAATFQDAARVPARYQPRFRVIASDVYVRELATDRSHMRDARGRWRRAPPPWDPPGAPAMNLASWTSGAPDGPGVVLDRAGLEDRWGIAR